MPSPDPQGTIPNRQETVGDPSLGTAGHGDTQVTPSPTVPPILLETDSHPPDLRQLLKFLPSKSDFDLLSNRLEASLQRVEEIKQHTSRLTTKVQGAESTTADLSLQVQDLQAQQEPLWSRIHKLQLQLEDLEDRNRRNNMKLTGIPEATPRPPKRLCANHLQ